MAIAVGSQADLGRSFSSSAWTTAGFNNVAGDCLFFYLFADTNVFSGTPPTVTRNGVAMTFVDYIAPAAPAYQGGLYVQMNPATGSFAFVVSRSASIDYIANAVSYTGTFTGGSGSSVLEAVAVNRNSTTNPLSQAVTVSTTGAWLVGLSTGLTEFLIAGTGTTARQGNSTNNSTRRYWALDSNGTVATGSRALAVDDQGAAHDKGILVASLLPAAGGGGGGLAIPVAMAQYRQRWLN